MEKYSFVVPVEASADDRATGFFRFVLTAFLLLSPIVLANSQEVVTVRAIQLTGNTVFPTDALLALLLLKSGSPFAEEVLKEDLKTLKHRFVDEGFPFAEIDTVLVLMNESSHTVDISIRVWEGKGAILRSVTFEGNGAMSEEEFLSGMASTPQSRFRPALLEDDLQFMLKLYEQAGFPYAKVSVRDVSLTQDDDVYHVDITVSIDEGEAVMISELKVEGNTRTKENVIVREARLKTDDIFTPDLQTRVQQRLQRLQLFSSVSHPELYLRDDGKGGLLVRVTEGSSNRFDGLVGYVPSGLRRESGYVTGLVNVQFLNLFGTGRKLSTRWHRENQSTQEVELRYAEPWIASYPVNGEVGFFQRKQDSLYVRRSYDLHAEFMLNEEFRIGASFSQMDVVPSESRTGFSVAESHTTTAGGFLFYDSRDDAVTPKSGIVYRTEFHTGKKRRTLATTASSHTTQRYGLDVEHYLSLFERQVLATSLHAREFRSGGVEISDLYRLGGTATLRGYREGQFLGSRVVWTNLEYRYLISPRSFFFAFADAGYSATPGQEVTGVSASEQAKLGYGVGLRVDTALGFVGVSIAFGQGDTFSTAKLHVRLINEF